MTRGQRLTGAIAAAAVVLLAGRGAAILYSDQEWYANLGAASVWDDRVWSTAWLFGAAIVIGIAFAWINVSSVRRSVVALIVPKRLANVEFGEEVPSARLRLLTAGVSTGVAALSLASLPSWTALALWRSNVAFAESDPYFTLDLSHFVSWLPLEIGAYQWCMTLFAITAILVIALYALTPSLTWDSRGMHVTPYARRHISALGAILLLLAAWGFRLDAFRELIHGSGPDGLFTRTDHVFLIPADVGLSLVSIGAAVVLLAAGWMGQAATSFIAVSVVIVGTLVAQFAGPFVSGRLAADPVNARSERPYVETRADFNARAFPTEPIAPSVRYFADSTLLANAGQIQIRGGIPDIVFPGAMGIVVVPDAARAVSAPRLGNGVPRFMHAWSEQNPRLLSGDIPSSDAFVRERDVRARVAALAPALAMSTAIGAIPTARGILWVVDLYSISETYPLSAPRSAGTTRITYRRHAGTAYVSGGTAATVIVPDAAPDPVARAWFSAHPGRYLATHVPADLLSPPPPAPPSGAASAPEERAFRQEVGRIYDRMRAALDSGNLRGFGATFDTLGMVIQGHK
ncbi:MAG: UPF0182 family protein [Gemmatimonadota bacterium]|nr:UPF0182 family protein [Gemmatimonadota bacterium]